jgi:hypothetical protein
MKKTVFECLGVAAIAFALQFTVADVQAAGLFSACNPCDEVACDPCSDADTCDPCDAVCGAKAGKWFLNGHVEAGFYANEYGQKSAYGGWNSYGRGANFDSGNTALLQNTRLTGAQINQVYLSMGKAVDGSRGLDIGGTVDFTWGSDAYLVQAGGMEFGAGHGLNGNTAGRWGTGDYCAAFAQAYAEIAYKRWNFIAGKFYAPFGSDDYRSTNNFFYSWSSNNLINPQVGGGAYAMYKVSDQLTAIGGWVMPEEVGESGDNNAVLGGFIWAPGKRFNVRYAFAAGENKYAVAPNSVEYFVHSLTTTTQISKRLKYVFDWSYNHSEYLGDNTDAYGLNNELIYQYNTKWAFGTRFGMLHGGLPVSNAIGEDWYTVAVGANWTPNKWLTVKPELRYDWFEKGAPVGPFDLTKGGYPGERSQLSGGMSAVVKF